MNSTKDYAPYLTPVWIYVFLFLILTSTVLLLGRVFGRSASPQTRCVAIDCEQSERATFKEGKETRCEFDTRQRG